MGVNHKTKKIYNLLALYVVGSLLITSILLLLFYK